MSTTPSPQFSRMSLNILMLVSVVLIVIFAAPGTKQAQKQEQPPLPKAPKINAQVWLSDSGSQVWYSPHLSSTIEIQLWFKAGFRYDGEFKGRANLLAQLLKYQSTQYQLPMQISLDQDFIKIALHLSTSAVSIKQQIDKTVALLYRPRLSNKLLKQLRMANHSASQDLRQKAYGQHAYAGPRQGTEKSLKRISRADLQKFQQQHLHPNRLFASIVGDLTEHSAQIIMETLLPPSKYKAASVQPLAPLKTSFASQNNMMVMVKPGLAHLEKAEQYQQLVNNYLLLQVLDILQPSQNKWINGRSNNTLYVQQTAQFRQNMLQDIDWDMILRAKRQLAGNWLSQVEEAPALSRYLVHLNAYNLPINHMTKSLQHLQSIDQDSWQKFYQQQLSTLSL